MGEEQEHMKYAGMPWGMWLLFRRSFQRQLTDTLEINRNAAVEITRNDHR